MSNTGKFKSDWRFFSEDDLLNLPQSPAEANYEGYYYTGKYCKHDHKVARHAKNQTCCQCHAEHSKVKPWGNPKAKRPVKTVTVLGIKIKKSKGEVK